MNQGRQKDIRYEPLDKLFNTSSFLTYFRNKQGEIVWYNDALLNFFNLTSKRNPEDSIAAFLENNLIPQNKAIDQQVISEQKPYENQVKLFNHILYIHKCPINFSNIDGIISIASDITEHVRSKQEILENMPGHVYWLNKSGIFLGCNKNMLNMLNLASFDEYIGKTYKELYEPTHIAVIEKTDKDVIKRDTSVNLEEEAINKNGTKSIYLTQKSPLHDANGKVTGLVGISLDITKQKELEHALKKAKQQAEVASEAKSEFIRNMSHDIRTPLSGIIGMAEILQSRKHDELETQCIDNLVKSSERLINLLNEILEMIEFESGSRPVSHEPISVKEIIEDVVALLQPEFTHKELTFNTTISNDVPKVLISDRLRIHRILLNLVGNSLKFTNEGKVDIVIDKLASENNKVILQFSVSDTGIGIPKNKLQTIFEKFARLTPSYEGVYEGSGLGLYIVKKMVGELDGQVSVTSEEGKGSTFTCTIPFELSKTENQQTNLKVSEKKSSYQTETEDKKQHCKILLVEDDKVCQLAVKGLSADMGCDVEIANNAYEALKMLNHSYDLIIMDIGLPDIDGITLAETIKKERKIKAPIIACTAHEWDRKAYMKAGMDGSLRKPITETNLQYIIRKHVYHLNHQP